MLDMMSVRAGIIRPGKGWFIPSPRWLVPIIYGISGIAFVADLCRDNNLAYGIIYAPLVATAVFHKSRASLWILGGIAIVMVIVGALMPTVSPNLSVAIGNRILSVLAIIATGSFVHHARDIQERLATETRRAEAAERIKTEVLANLSQEMRTPLRTFLGVLSLALPTIQPDQREALGQARNDGKQLLATIDNVFDLTLIEERTLQRQPIDLATIARDAAESARAVATERQVSIAMEPDHDASGAAAMGDSWALRRILDNLLANAVRLTPPGGKVSVAVARSADRVIASVSDTGKGLAPELSWDLSEDSMGTDASVLPMTGGTGLVLSRRLARAMNGQMTARNQPGSGATVTLSLPAADRQAA